jgi:N-methylhydantoinase A
VHIHAHLAQQAVERVAEPLGVSVMRAAEAIVQTADATMARALRRISVERGIDPRDMPLMAFGGGGPLHACGLAERLGMTRIVIPPHAGVLSALGLAMAPERRERISNCVVALASWSDEALHDTLRAAARSLGGTPADTSWWLRTRYVGQGYELDIPVSLEDSLAHVIARFGERHHERTGYVLPRDVECISVRTAVQHTAWPTVFERAADDVANTRPFEGPAVIALPDATLHVASGWRATALDVGGWMLERLT